MPPGKPFFDFPFLVLSHESLYVGAFLPDACSFFFVLSESFT